MQRKSLVMVAAAVAAGLASTSAWAQSVAVTIGVRESNSVAPVGEPGGTAGSIEWINKDAQSLLLNDTWQSFVWNFGTDPVAAFVGNGTLNGTRGTLEHIRFLNGVGSADSFEIFIDGLVNTVAGTPTTLTGFESTETPPADLTDPNGGFLFRAPTLSGTTAPNLAASPNISQVTDELADTGTQSLKASWAFIDAATTRWVRFTTFNAAEKANPTIDFTSGNSLTMRIRGRIVGPAVRWTSTSAAANWSDAANWNAGTVAGSTGATGDSAFFGAVNTAPTVVTADIPLTLNTLRLRSANSYTFETSDPIVNTLTLTGPLAVSSTNINAEQGSHTINVPILLPNKALAVTVGEAAATLTLANVNFDPNGVGAGQTLIKNGPGTLVLPQFQSFVSNPDDTPPTPPLPSRSLTINEGAVKLTASTGGAVVSRANRLIMSGAPGAWTGKLDLNNNALILDYADPTLGGINPLGLQEDRLIQGYAGGAWNGNGIASSAAAAAPGTAVGIADIVDLGSPATFLGQPVDGSTVVMRYTRSGDANLSGGVDLDDFTVLAANFGLAGRWAKGDFNYDGNVNLDDFTALASNFGTSIPGDAPRSSVPEPGMLSALGLAAAGLMGRRRRA